MAAYCSEPTKAGSLDWSLQHFVDTMQVEAEPSSCRIELLQSQAEQQQQLLQSLLQRAESAEAALKEVQTALTQAEDIAAALQRRNNTVEVADVVTSCVAAFLAASAGTLYLLY